MFRKKIYIKSVKNLNNFTNEVTMAKIIKRVLIMNTKDINLSKSRPTPI